MSMNRTWIWIEYKFEASEYQIHACMCGNSKEDKSCTGTSKHSDVHYFSLIELRRFSFILLLSLKFWKNITGS